MEVRRKAERKHIKGNIGAKLAPAARDINMHAAVVVILSEQDSIFRTELAYRCQDYLLLFIFTPHRLALAEVQLRIQYRQCHQCGVTFYTDPPNSGLCVKLKANQIYRLFVMCPL